MNLLKTLLPNVACIQLNSFTINNSGDDPIVEVNLSRTNRAVRCPHCGVISHRFHSYYSRTVEDLGLCNFHLQLNLSVKKYYCLNPSCRFKIFCERLGQEIQVYQRKTSRLKKEMLEIALKTGANPASRLCKKLYLKVSSSTLLRFLHGKKLQDYPTPRVLGVDDWAFRKGDYYGTILVDLERGCPIDLLSDRTSETLKSWLERYGQQT